MNLDLPAHVVAPTLIGCYLKVNDTIVQITEVEAYEDDEASHAFKRTPRSDIMYDTVGYVYVYLIYGMHYCLNITTTTGKPGAVLIRGAKHVSGPIQRTDLNGPGKLCQALGVTKEWNNTALGDKIELIKKPSLPSTATPRIGIRNAQDLLWRWIINK